MVENVIPPTHHYPTLPWPQPVFASLALVSSVTAQLESLYARARHSPQGTGGRWLLSESDRPPPPPPPSSLKRCLLCVYVEPTWVCCVCVRVCVCMRIYTHARWCVFCAAAAAGDLLLLRSRRSRVSDLTSACQVARARADRVARKFKTKFLKNDRARHRSAAAAITTTAVNRTFRVSLSNLIYFNFAYFI